MLRKIAFLCIILLSSVISLFAEDKVNISGIVVDEYDKPVEFATVRVNGQAVFSMTNAKGKYNLNCSREDSLVLVCSMIGYRTRKFPIMNPADSIKMTLKISSTSIVLGEAGVKGMRIQTNELQKISTKALKNLPSTTGNAVEELITTQMGVSTHSELSSQYNVRGGSFDENFVYLNGVEVYRPMLVRSGQQEGLSIINSNMVQDIDFSAGGFPACYGDKMSSVLDITYKHPEKFEASLAGSFMGADAYVGFGNKNFSMLNGLRYKTPKYLLGSTDTNGEYKPSFLDYQNYTSWSPTKHWIFDFIGNISNNIYNFKPIDRETKFGTAEEAHSFKVYFDGQEKDKFQTYFTSFGITHKFNNQTNLKWLISSYSTKEQETYDISGEYWLDEATSQEQLGVGTYLEHARNFLTANVFNTSLQFNTQIKTHKISAAFGYKSEKIKENSVEWEYRDSSDYSMPHQPDKLNLIYNLRAKNDINTTRIEGYAQDTYRFGIDAGRITLNYGLRFSHWNWNSETLISPRLSIGFVPQKNYNWAFRFATGVYYQAPFYKEIKDTTTINGNTYVTLNKGIKSQKSIQFVLGADYQFQFMSRPFRFTTEAYYKSLSNIIPYNINNLRVVYYGQNLADGHIAGIDFKLFGEFVPGTDSWLTFSLMSTNQNYNGMSLPLPTDQRYNFSLFFTDYFPGSTKWRMTLKAEFADGLPFGAPHTGIEKNYFRAPSYRRVDMGMNYHLINNEDKKHKSPYAVKNAWLGFDVFNVLGINNVNSYYWVTDINNMQYAVPNYLTGRRLNLRLLLEW